jgi:hypothetical protein
MNLAALKEFDRDREERSRNLASEKRGGAELNEMLIKKRKAPNTGASGGGGGGDASSNSVDDGATGGNALPPDEVKSRLRSMGQPVTYFGETEVRGVRATGPGFAVEGTCSGCSRALVSLDVARVCLILHKVVFRPTTGGAL